MQITGIIFSTAVVGAVGLLFGIILSVAAKKFKVEVSEKVEKIMEILPGANCGACGAAGCSGFAEGLVKEKYKVNGCIPGGQEVADKISSILGVKAEVSEKLIAFIECDGDREKSPDIAEYSGFKTCISADMIVGGTKSCSYGCIGFGDCVDVCLFDAIFINSRGLPEVIKEKCTGCGKCAEVCPKNIIKIKPASTPIYIACSNPEKLKNVKEVCKVGCIGCSLCTRKAPKDSMKMEGSLPILQGDFPKDQSLYEEAVKSCPTKCIKFGGYISVP